MLITKIMLYRLTEDNATAINRRRADGARNMNRHRETADGTQVHTGNPVAEGDEYPMIVVRTWGPPPGGSVNGQVILDGNDTLWVSSVSEGDGPGKFRHP